jgi:hypothetical protein
VPIAFDDDVAVAAPEQMARDSMAPVEVLGVAAVQRLHTCCNVGFGRGQEGVVVRCHLAVGVADPPECADGLSQESQELDPVEIIAIEALFTDRLREDVIRSVRTLADAVVAACTRR